MALTKVPLDVLSQTPLTAPTANSAAGWDSNKNISANSLIEGYTTTATAAGTTTLVVGSTYQQFFTGTTTQTVLLPVASTLVLGQQFVITNNSTGIVTVQSSGANTIQAMASNTQIILTCILASGTGIASWGAVYSSLAIPAGFANPMTTGGDTIYGGASGAPTRLANGTIGQVLTSAGGVAAPSWTTVSASSVWTITAAKTSAYTAAAGEFIPVTGTSASFTVTLPTAVGISGRMIQLKRTDNTLAYTVTVATTSAQTIDGYSTRRLSTKDEWIIFVSDGANWYIQNRGYSGVQTQFTATAANLGTLTTNTNCYWWREGSNMAIRYFFAVGTPATATAQIDLPGGTVSVATSNALLGNAVNDSTSSFPGTIIANNANSFLYWSFIGSAVTPSNALTPRNGDAYVSVGVQVQILVRVPMTNWD